MESQGSVAGDATPGYNLERLQRSKKWLTGSSRPRNRLTSGDNGSIILWRRNPALNFAAPSLFCGCVTGFFSSVELAEIRWSGISKSIAELRQRILQGCQLLARG